MACASRFAVALTALLLLQQLIVRPVACWPCDLSPLTTLNGTWSYELSLEPNVTKAILNCTGNATLVGSGVSFCPRSTELWSDLTSLCLFNPCPVLAVVSHGNSSGLSASVNGTVHFGCVPGYVFSGDVNRTCRDDGTWTGAANQGCARVLCQPDPLTIVHGVSSVATGYFNDTAIMSCNAGYVLFGPVQRRCLASGLWSGLSICTGVSCPTLTAPGNGTADYLAGVVGSVSTFACNFGFTLSGTVSRTCQADGTWTGLANQHCQPNSCAPPLTAPGNGTVSRTTGSTGDIAVYSCNAAYVLAGPRNTTCNATGVWVPALAAGGVNVTTCERRVCNLPLRAPLNGTMVGFGFAINSTGVTTPNVGRYGDLVRFSCNAGFAMSGFADTNCTASGNWSAVPPLCVRVQCPALPALQDGTETGLGGLFEDRIAYACNFGFAMTGPAAILCQANATWSSPPPLCLARSPCVPPVLPSPGPHVVATLWNETDGSGAAVMRFTCESGYALVGAANRTCLPELRWSGGVNQTCVPVPCATNVTAPLNGTLLLAGGGMAAVAGAGLPYVTGSNLTVVCNSGFAPATNGTTLVCGPTGNWTVPPACVPRPCLPALVRPLNGTLSLGGSGVVGDRGNFTCDFDFDLTGPATRLCQLNGTWTGAAAPTHCALRLCANLTLLNGVLAYDEAANLTAHANGTVAANMTVGVHAPGTNATATCGTGYTLGGTVLRTCALGGNWTGQALECVGRPCSANLTAPGNGTIDRTEGLVGDDATYRCNAGFALFGTAVRRCSVQRTWTALAAPICVATNCSGLAAPEHGSVSHAVGLTNITARFGCELGWTLAGDAARTCLNGSWSGAANQSCVPNTCPTAALARPSNGSLTVESNHTLGRAHYACDAGYALAYPDEAAVVCLASGNWSRTNQSCVPRLCAVALTAPTNGTVDTPGAVGVGQERYFNCSDGFERIGPASVLCMPSGNFSAPLPRCAPIACRFNQSAPANGTVVRGGGRTGERDRFVCNAGFLLEGAEWSLCLASGNWSAANNQTCVNLTACIPPGFAAPDHGSVALLPNTPSAGQFTSAFECVPGYILRGYASRVCNAAVSHAWTAGVQFCEAMPCVETLAAPANGTVTPATGTTDTVARFACNQGFALATGPSVERVCTSQGNWTGTGGQACVAVACTTDLWTPAHGTLTAEIRTLSANGTGNVTAVWAVVGCNLGYRMEGPPPVRVCPVGGRWNSSANATCVFVTCPARPLTVTNGAVAFAQTGADGAAVLNTTATYRCAATFGLIGTAQHRCLLSGQWSVADAPTCAKIYARLEQVVFDAAGTGLLAGAVIVARTITVPASSVLTIAADADVHAPYLLVRDSGTLVILIEGGSPMPLTIDGSVSLGGTLLVVLGPSVNFTTALRLITFGTSANGAFDNVTVVVATELVPELRDASGAVRAAAVRRLGPAYITGSFACSAGLKFCALSPIIAHRVLPPKSLELRAKIVAGVIGGLLGAALIGGVAVAVYFYGRRDRHRYSMVGTDVALERALSSRSNGSHSDAESCATADTAGSTAGPQQSAMQSADDDITESSAWPGAQSSDAGPEPGFT